MSSSVLPDPLADRIAPAEPEPDVGLAEFFDPSFMAAHTEFERFEAFREASPWPGADAADPAAGPTDELDAFVADTTEFDSWLAMRNAAAEAAVVDRLMA